MSLESFNERWPDNVEGKYYVDETCLDCDLCRETAPKNFSRNNEEGYSYISKQPENREEEGMIQDAIEGCPCESIFADGDLFDWKKTVPERVLSQKERELRIQNKECSHCSVNAKKWWQFWK